MGQGSQTFQLTCPEIDDFEFAFLSARGLPSPLNNVYRPIGDDSIAKTRAIKYTSYISRGYAAVAHELAQASRGLPEHRPLSLTSDLQNGASIAVQCHFSWLADLNRSLSAFVDVKDGWFVGPASLV